MTESQTESFCERCGTRYTFESASPKVRLKGVKVLSRGLKNFVLSDETSIEDAMAAARSEADRETTAHQLDAFHDTFNFCLSCRQYSCPNCWNEDEARCLSCAPLAPAEAAAASDGFKLLHETVAVGEQAPGNGTTDQAPGGWPGLKQIPARTWSVESPPVMELEVEPIAAAEPAAEPIAATEPEPEPTIAAETPFVPDEAAGKATAQTADLLKRFRPGQNLDSELAAFERERGDAADTDEPAAERATPEAEPETVFVTQPEPVAAELAASDEPETIDVATVEPEAATVLEEPAAIRAAAPEPEPTIETAPEPEPEPLAAAAGTDIIEQPTWQIAAPDSIGTTPGMPLAGRDGAVPQQATVTPAELPTVEPPSPEPQWPASPQWPGSAPGAGLPFPSRSAIPEGGIEALWAASSQELVTAPPAPGRANNGIRPCVSCGLSLSANARFCRRCGTLQAG